MGQTVLSATVGSRQVLNDDDVDAKAGQQVPTPVVTFTTFGTSPVVNALGGGPGRLRLKVTSGTGAGTAAANNIILTFPTGSRTPRKVYVAGGGGVAFYLGSIASNVVNIGGVGNSVASTAYDVDLIFVY